jgi:alkyl hydroperoxide reductase subunit D
MLVLTSVALLAASLCSISYNESAAGRRRARLRWSAEAAALRGRAELQATAGPDARHTYPDSRGRLQAAGRNEARPVDGMADADSLRLSWEVRDLSMACDRAAGAAACEQASAWAKGAGARPRLPRALPAALTGRQRQALQADAAAAGVSPSAIEDAKAAAILMSQNNIFYRFRHAIGKDVYAEKPARLRMLRLNQVMSNKADMDLFSFAVSAINFCQACMNSHEEEALKHGLSEDQVNDAVRIASVIHAAAVALEVG